MKLTDVSIDTIVALAKQKETKWCLAPKSLFYLKFFVKKKVTTMNNHTASLEILWTCMSPCCHGNVFWTSNWKHVIKCDLYV